MNLRCYIHDSPLLTRAIFKEKPMHNAYEPSIVFSSTMHKSQPSIVFNSTMHKSVTTEHKFSSVTTETIYCLQWHNAQITTQNKATNQTTPRYKTNKNCKTRYTWWTKKQLTPTTHQKQIAKAQSFYHTVLFHVEIRRKLMRLFMKIYFILHRRKSRFILFYIFFYLYIVLFWLSGNGWHSLVAITLLLIHYYRWFKRNLHSQRQWSSWCFRRWWWYRLGGRLKSTAFSFLVDRLAWLPFTCKVFGNWSCDQCKGFF